MKRCPSCIRTYDDETLSFCPNDGARLVADASPPAGSEDPLQATIMATPSMRPPSSELPPPDAFSTNAASGSGQFNQQPPQQNPGWTDNQYQANAPWPNQQQQQMPPPPQNPTWQQTPSGGLPPPQAKKGMNTKLLIGGGLGCLGLLIVGVIGIAIIFAMSGPSGKMNPYKGSLRDLAPESIGSYKQTDLDTLGDRDKEGFGRIREAIGLAYTKGSEDKVQVFIGKYDSAADAKDGLKSFKSRLSSSGWTTTAEKDKKIGWSTVGTQFYATRTFSRLRGNDSPLQDGARMVYAQSASPSPSTKRGRSITCWTNGSVIYAIAADDSVDDYTFVKELDKGPK